MKDLTRSHVPPWFGTPWPAEPEVWKDHHHSTMLTLFWHNNRPSDWKDVNISLFRAFRVFFFGIKLLGFSHRLPLKAKKPLPCRKVVQVLSDQHRSAFQQVATLSSDLFLGVFFVCCFFLHRPTIKDQTLGIQSPCQMMIGVYNHLLRKVFRSYYHSQKMIGSLGKGPGCFFLLTGLMDLADGNWWNHHLGNPWCAIFLESVKNPNRRVGLGA